jgi:hypothetical protein
VRRTEPGYKVAVIVPVNLLAGIPSFGALHTDAKR